MSLKRYAFGLAAIGLASTAMAQPPINLATPVGPGAFPPMAGPLPGPGPVGIAPRPAMPTQNTLWSYLGVSADQREYRQRANADTRLGELRQRLLPNPRLKTPSLAELQAPGPVGAASQVKLDRANAEKRIEAVQYLGTVDCHVWPEAEDALIGALRGDRNECVRLTAAQVLLNCCCCTKKVIKALTEAASGTDCDGFPAEKSCRVRAAAQAALEKCLTCFCDMESKCPDKNCDKKNPEFPKKVDPPKSGEGPGTTTPKGETGKVTPDGFYATVPNMPSATLIIEARKALTLAIPMDSDAINQLDLIAAGEPGPFDAGLRSPKPSSLIGFFTSKPEPQSTSTIMERPLVATKQAPVKSVVTPATTTTVAAKPVVNAIPPLKSGTTTVSNSSPLTAPKPAPAVTAAPVSVPKPLPVSLPAAKPDRAEKVAKMMKGLVPVTELTAGIDQLTADDLKTHPALVSDLIAAGSRSTSVPVRLSTMQALVRCNVKTPEAVSVLQTAAQTDPDSAVRTAAAAGLK
ncbi:MAG: hypothetical protein U0791_15435 [Gemmataceae bacterium]